MRKTVIRLSNGFVINIIEIEANSPWPLPDGCGLIDAGDGSPGDTWDGTKFIKPLLPKPEPIRDLFAEIDSIKAEIEILKNR